MNQRRAFDSRAGLRLAALLLLFPLAVAKDAAAQAEGYDPLRQITKQLVKANLLIVLDTTGSMADDVDANKLSQGENGVGDIQWSGTGSGCRSGLCTTWTYKLAYEAPSRISTVKNALGDSVSLLMNYAPLASWATDRSILSGTWQAGTVTLPTAASLAAAGPWSWSVTYATRKADPGIPFTAYGPGTPNANGGGRPLAGMGTWTDLAAQDVVGLNKDAVNWGLVAFSSNRGDCAKETLFVPIDTTDGNDVSGIEAQLKSQTAGGLSVGGYTNTVGALKFAKDVMAATYSGTAVTGTLTDSQGNSFTLRADPKALCARPYGVIVATDGLSNRCNPSDGNWISPCGAVAPVKCDVGSSGYDCPNAWASFAAGASDAIWNLNLGTGTYTPRRTVPIHPRVFSIGVSPEVGPCELDFISFMGRTDADSPNGDAGYGGYQPNAAKANYNPYLPQVPPTIPAGGIGATSSYDGPTGQYKYSKNTSQAYNPPSVGHGHNAFFATSPQAISEAFARIINATALGDYATNAATSASGIGSGNTVVLPSAEFPSWRGHLYEYVYDFSKPPADPLYRTLKWDAGNVLSNPAATGYKTPDARLIYTWDASNNLVPVDAAHLSQLQTIAGANGLANPAATFTANVVDFIRGYDGTLARKPRNWAMGPPINSTPALTGPPQTFFQITNVASHAQFEQDYAQRFPLVWVGSDDGMMHAFRFDNGAEELGILPPNLLPAQVSLYANYKDKSFRVTGQPDRIDAHLYGAASSLHYADVYFPFDSPKPSYHTLGILTEGPGGPLVAALEITHPFSGDTSARPPIAKDKNYDSNAPFSVLWSRTGGAGAGQVNGLYGTWSVPALAATTSNNWTLLLGAGFNPASTKAAQVAPKSFSLSLSTLPTSPAVNTLSLSNGGPAPLVGNQAFADSVLFSTRAQAFYSDNVADLGLQADLDGRIWFLTGSDLTSPPALGIDANAAVVAPGTSLPSRTTQPLYYPPAVSGYGAGNKGCDLFAFGSGSYYEKSALVSGAQIGAGPSAFYPSLFLAVNSKPVVGSPAPAIPSGSAQVVQVPISGTTFQLVPATGAPTSKRFGPHTQLTAPPFIVVPVKGPGTPAKPAAFFLLYDPDDGCNGEAFVIRLDFDIGATCTSALTINSMSAYDAGAGAGSGFVVVGGHVGAVKSGVGLDASGNPVGATIYFPPNANAGAGGPPTVTPTWWRELK